MLACDFYRFKTSFPKRGNELWGCKNLEFFLICCPASTNLQFEPRAEYNLLSFFLTKVLMRLLSWVACNCSRSVSKRTTLKETSNVMCYSIPVRKEQSIKGLHVPFLKLLFCYSTMDARKSEVFSGSLFSPLTLTVQKSQK